MQIPDLMKFLADLMANVALLQAQMGELQTQLVDAQEKLEKVAKDAYDKGFEAGKASVVCDPEKKYTQEDLDAAIGKAVVDLKALIRAKLDELLA